MPFDPSRPFDVAIAGAGLAGASLALRLGRSGARVALVDAATFPRDKLCGEFLSPESWGVLGRLGLADDVDRLGYHPIRRVRLSTPRGRVIDAEFAPAGSPPGIGLSRSALDTLLVDRARAAGVAVVEGTRVGGPIIEEGRVVGIAGRHAEAGRVEIRARVVVAADGRHSRLVDATGRSRVRSLFRPRLFGLKRHLEIDGPADFEPEWTVGLHLVPGGYAGTCRVEGGIVNVCALIPEAAARASRGDLDRVAGDHLASNPSIARLWGAGRPWGPWKTVSGVRVESATPALAGIFYAGDCRGTVDPLGGQGMTMALLGAEVLAPFVASAVAAGTAGRTLQRAYDDAWHARFIRRITLCRAFHHALLHPALIDLASRRPREAENFLARCFDWTRDRTRRDRDGGRSSLGRARGS